MVFKDNDLVKEYLSEAIECIRGNIAIHDVLTKLLMDAGLWQHSVNVAQIAVQIGIYLGFTHQEVFDLAVGGLLHDVGKLSIPEEILYKPSKLTDEEFDLIKEHSEKGIQLLSFSGVSSAVADMILHHHEKLDGSGYPDGLVAIKPLTQIITVADIFGALSEPRCYHEGMSLNNALKFITQFGNINQDIVSVLVDIISD